LLVVAGAGAGKTFSAKERVGYAIHDGFVKPERMLFVSFTNKAVKEMKDRLVSTVGEAVNDVIGRTIHSFCRWVVVTNYKTRLAGRYNGPTWENVLDESLAQTVLQAICEKEKLEIGPAYVARWISDAKKERQDPTLAYDWYKNNLIAMGLDDWLSRKIARQLQTASKWYEDVKLDPYCLKSDYVIKRMSGENGKVYLRAGFMDFQDMLNKAQEILESDAEARAWFQDRIGYVIVDEAQDTGPEMFVLETVARPWDGAAPLMTAVGDTKQSIYRFRGAVPDQILYQWKSRHGDDAQVKFITMNWRSSNSRIVFAANHLARDANPEYNQPMTTRPDATPGAMLTYTFLRDSNEEANHVVGTISDYLDDKKCQPKDVAIIYRTNAQSRAFEDELIKHGIPYVVVNATGFFDRKVVKDLLAFLKLMNDPNDMDSLFRIRNMPSKRFIEWKDKTTRFLGPATFDKFHSSVAKLQTAPDLQIARLNPWRNERAYSYPHLALQEYANSLPDWKAASIDDFVETLEFLFEMSDSKVSPAQALLNIYDHTYLEWIKRREGLYEDAGTEADPVFELMDELVNVASRYKDVGQFLAYVESTQKAMREMDATDNGKQPQQGDDRGKVMLLTGHKAKGLEWPIVFVVGVSDGIVPHIMSKPGAVIVSKKGQYPVLNKPDLEAELNWLYVALTRGEQETHVSGISIYRNRVCPPCAWMMDLVAAEQVLLTAGEQVDFGEIVSVLMDADAKPDKQDVTENYRLLKYNGDLLIVDSRENVPVAALWNKMFVGRAGTFVNIEELQESALYQEARY